MLTNAEAFTRLTELKPVTLAGRLVRLEPMNVAHFGDLCKVGLDPEIWRLMVYGPVRTEEELDEWMREMLKRQAEGKDLPFSLFHVLSGRAVGCTRYMNVEAAHRHLEIGGTWLGRAFQGSGMNVEAKYLLLQYAFETLGCFRVQLKTDVRNIQSQRAIERLGAMREGVLRKHMILPDGSIRDSVYYSIVDEEWPQVKIHLETRLEAHKNRPA
jgi:RimJ/RimL family protein N-acetyltransferase